VTIVDKGKGYKTAYNSDNAAESFVRVFKYAQSEEEPDSIILTRVDNQNIQANVTWNASGEKDYIGTATTLKLQRRLYNDESATGAWEDVQKSDGGIYEATTSPATSTTRTLKVRFNGVSKYSDEGKTYEFRVVETAFTGQSYALSVKTPAGGNTYGGAFNDAAWDESRQSAGGLNVETTNKAVFRYNTHGYEAVTTYCNTDSSLTIINTLKDDTEFVITTAWSYSNIPYTSTYVDDPELTDEENAAARATAEAQAKSDAIEAFKARLLSKLTLKDTEGNAIGNTVTYTLYRGGTAIAKITPVGQDDNGYKFEIKAQSGYESEIPAGSYGYVGYSDESNVIKWVFDISDILTLPRYDETGNKYSYTIGESDHSDLASDYSTLYSNGTGYSTSIVNNRTRLTASQTHYFGTGGVSYYFHINKVWHDSITDLADRSVSIHIVALKEVATESGTEYQLIKDLGQAKLDGEALPNSTTGGYYERTLSNANNFDAYIYYKPIADTDAIYAAVEYSITYQNEVQNTGFASLSPGDTVPAGYLITGATVSKPETTVKFDSAADEIQIYSYTIEPSVTSMSSYPHIDENGQYNRTALGYSITNSINPISIDMDVTVNWVDDKNSGNHRSEGLLVELWRSLGNTSTQVKDENGLPYTKIWKTSDNTIAGQGNTTYTFTSTDTFTNLPLCTEEGETYQYEIRQYIVEFDEDGETVKTKHYIDPSTSSAASETMYITSETKTEDYELVGSNVKINTHYVFTNQASNADYSTEVYLLWKDLEAYSHSSRPDMQYDLYYTVGDDAEDTMVLYDLSEYTSFIRTADTGIMGISSNPYYQKITFNGLREFDDNGIKIHYYVKSSKIDNGKTFYTYKATYYENGSEDLVRTDDKPSALSTYYFYDFSESATIAETAGDYVCERGIISYTTVGYINVSGKKQWVNVREGSVKPDCTVYLFRESKYDTDNKLVESEFDENNPQGYLRSVAIDTTANTYKFLDGENLENFAKYDKYGSTYTYEVREVMTRKTDHKVIHSLIITGTSENSQLLVNTFDMDGKNRRNITIEKSWERVDEETVINNPPVAKFYVYRLECDYTLSNGYNPYIDEVTYSDVIGYINSKKGASTIEKYISDNAELVATKYIQYDKTAADKGSASVTLTGEPIYAPDGLPYAYFVVEDASYVSSYEISNDATDAITSDTGAGYDITTAHNVVFLSNQGISLSNSSNNTDVSFLNTYKGTKFIKITGTIQWNEGITAIGNAERPSEALTDADPAKYIKFTVKRSALSQKEYSRTDTNADDEVTVISYSKKGQTLTTDPVITWTDKGNGLWQYTIECQGTDGFLVYSENGNAYSYKITESYNSVAAGADDAEKINATTKNYYPSSNNQTRSAAAVGNGIDAIATADIDSNTLAFSRIYNVLRGTYYVQKSWADGYDSYGLRPLKVLAMYQYYDESTGKWNYLKYADGLTGANASKSGKIVVTEVSKETSWKSYISNFPLKDKDSGNWYKYRVVEIGLGYAGKWVQTTDVPVSDYVSGSKALAVPAGNGDNMTSTYYEIPSAGTYGYVNGDTDDINTGIYSTGTYGSYRVFQVIGNGQKGTYTTGVQFADGNGNLVDTRTSTVKNTLDQSTYLTITKRWVDDNNALQTRPSSVNVELQYRTVTISDDGVARDESDYDFSVWTHLTDTTITARDVTAADSNVWETKFKNLPVYDENGKIYEYRAVEKGEIFDTDGNVTGTAVLEPADDSTHYSEDHKSYVYNNITSGSVTNGYEQYSLKSDSVAADGTGIAYVAGTYLMTSYKYTAAGNNYSIEITNTLDDAGTVTVDKDWVVADSSAGTSGDETAATAGYTATAQVDIKYGSETKTVDKVLTKTDAVSGDKYAAVWSLPKYKYTAANATNGVAASRKVISDDAVSVSEKYANTGAAAAVSYETKNKNNNTVGTFTGAGTTWIVNIADASESGNTTFTITNTPLTKHKYSVVYEGDLKNKYSSRPTNITALLQYRIKGTEDGWISVTAAGAGSEDFYKGLLSGVDITSAGTKTIDTGNLTTETGAYSLEVDKLPKYGLNSGTVVEYEYRFIETTGKYGAGGTVLAAAYADTALQAIQLEANAYGDKSVSGYTYAYTFDTDETKLQKTYLKIKLSGTKVWSDASADTNGISTTPDLYKTRPDFYLEDGTTYSGAAAVTVYTDVAKTKTIVEPSEITWSLSSSYASDNTWKFETNQNLPKYAVGTNSLATYYVSETTVDKRYTASTATTPVGRDAEAAVISGNSNFMMSAITNAMKETVLTVEKTWDNQEECKALGFEQVSVTYILQKRLTETDSFADYKDRNGKTVTIKLLYDASGSTVGTIDNIPTHDAAGNAYSYRFIEKELEVKFHENMADPSDPGVIVKYALVASETINQGSRIYDVTETIGAVTKTFGAGTVKISETAANGFSYEIGPMKATAVVTGAGASKVYGYTNTKVYATANAVQKWSEKKVGGSTNDATLKAAFRPVSVNYVLQQKADGDTTWSTYKSSSVNVSSSGSESYDISRATLLGTMLPVYGLRETSPASGTYEVVKYAYRTAESSFVYSTGASDGEKTRALTYDTNIEVDFDSTNSNKLLCENKISGKLYYTGETVNSVSGYDFTTTISNTLEADLLYGNVFMTLKGCIEWIDESDTLGKRAATLPMIIVAKWGDSAGTVKSAEFTLGDADLTKTTGTTTISGTLAGETQNLELEWKKNVDNTWTFTIEKAPRYSNKGDLITYSVVQKEKPEDYTFAVATGADRSKGQVTVGQAAYDCANGKVTDTKNIYGDSGKIIEYLDFVETMTTSLTVTKMWIDNQNQYGMRPGNITVKMQRRQVTVDANGDVVEATATAWTDMPSGYDTTISADEADVDYFTTTVGSKSVVVDRWKYVYEELEQFATSDGSGVVYQYRVLERAAEYSADLSQTKTYTYLEDTIPNLIANHTYDSLEKAPHEGSYYLTDYAYGLEGKTGTGNQAGQTFGRSTTDLTDTLDKRDDIVVEKVWNTSDQIAAFDTVTITLSGKSINANSVTKEPTVYTAVLQANAADADKNWKQKWTNIPKYDEYFDEIVWDVEEIKAGTNDVTHTSLVNKRTTNKNGSDLYAGAYFTDGSGNHWTVNYDERIENLGTEEIIVFTVTNTPSVNAGLAVEYADDLNNDYGTRFAKSSAKLQCTYIEVGGTVGSNASWYDVTKTSTPEVYQIIVKDIATGITAGQAAITQTQTSNTASYSYAFDYLPKYVTVGAGGAASRKEVVYRVIEDVQGEGTDKDTVVYSNENTDITNLSIEPSTSTDANAAGDTTSCGYVYTYSVEAGNNKLTKTLLTTKVTGEKKWDDFSDQYATRPLITASPRVIDVKISEAGISAESLHQPSRTWQVKADDDDVWEYTTGNMPKYNAHTNTLASYKAEEICTSTQYDIVYSTDEENTAGVADIKTTVKDTAAVNSNLTVTMNNITNKLKGVDIVAKKEWINSSNNAPAYDVTFILERKGYGDSDYSAYTYIDQSGATVTDDAVKILTTTDSTNQVKWEGLPTVDKDGHDVAYRVTEVTHSGYVIYNSDKAGKTAENVDKRVSTRVQSTDEVITYTFTNIETTGFEVDKNWLYVVPEIIPSTESSFSAAGILEQHIEGAAADSWSDATDFYSRYDAITPQVLQWSITTSKTDVVDASYTGTYTFTELPLYTEEGKKITYKAKETKINNQELEGASPYTDYDILYNNETSGKTVITNVFKVVELSFTKKDATSLDELENVTFALYETTKTGNTYNPVDLENATPIYSAQTDSDGNWECDITKATDYALVETVTKTGYVTCDPVYFTVKDSDFGKGVHLEFTDKVKNARQLGTLTIYKQDGDTDGAVNGATFEIYKKNPATGLFERIKNFLTGKTYGYVGTVSQGQTADFLNSERSGYNADGTTVIKNIEWGEYYIQEIAATDGYTLKSDKYYFEVKAENVASPIELYSEGGTKLSDGDGRNRIILRNYKNRLTFQLYSVDGTRLYTDGEDTKGVFKIYKVENGVVSQTPEQFYLAADETGGKVSQFTIAYNSGTGVISDVNIYGLAYGYTYVIHEVSAPENYFTNDDVRFYIKDNGKIMTSDGALATEYASGLVTMKNMPYGSIKVTKVFDNDDDWVKDIRPDKVNIQLYKVNGTTTVRTAVGEEYEIDVNTSDNSYTIAYSELPLYEMSGGVAQPLTYEAEEVTTDEITDFYMVDSGSSVVDATVIPTQAGAGTGYVQTITNDAVILFNPGTLQITKTNVGGPLAAEFELHVTYGFNPDRMVSYRGTYSRIKADTTSEDFEAEDGKLYIASGETVEIKLPKGATYVVEEILEENEGTTQYDKEITLDPQHTGYDTDNNPIILEDTLSKVDIVNTCKIHTGINNTTENESVENGENGRHVYNAGGKIGVINPVTDDDGDESDSDYDEVDYQPGSLGVYWKNQNDWAFSDSFTVNYVEFSDGSPDDGETKTITVNHFIDENGNIKPISDSCYDELRVRYPDFGIRFNTKGSVVLRLANNTDGMPYLNAVEVGFLPTIAIMNTTAERAGGFVKVDGGTFQRNSDGMHENDDDRYVNQTKVYAQADEGYGIDLEKLQFGIVGSIQVETGESKANGIASDGAKMETIYQTINDDNTFSSIVSYEMAGETSEYVIEGSIEVTATDKKDNPTAVTITLDNLPIPVDAGIAFTKVKNSTPPKNPDDPGNGDSDPAHQGDVKTYDDTSSLYEYLLLLALGIALMLFGVKRKKKTDNK